MEPIRILAIPGSLRRKSYNRMLLGACRELAPDSLELEIASLEGIPLFNADEEAEGTPEPVEALRDKLRKAQGMLIATPEYNQGVPGVLKNGIDWLSRPPRESAMDGKPVAILGASPGMLGTARAQPQLRQAFVFTNSYCMIRPEIFVARCAEKFDDEGRLTDEATMTALGKFLESFEAWVRRFA